MIETLKRRALVLEAMACVAAASTALRLAPVRVLLKPGAPAATAAEDAREAERVAAAMRSAVRRAPWLGKCLAQSLALRRMLARRGVASTVHLSVGRGEERDLAAHAWVTVGAAVVHGGGPPPGQVAIFASRPLPPKASA